MTRAGLTGEDLAGVVRRALGPARRLDGLTRLTGGSKKGVYRLAIDDGSTAVLYSWDRAENYWPDHGDTPTDPLGGASGIELFHASHAALAALGVRTPRVLHLERDPTPLAVLEDVRGGTLEALLGRDPRAAEPALARLGTMLEELRRHRAPRIGKVAELEQTPQDRSCEQIVLDRALGHLAEASARVERIAAARADLAELLLHLAAAVRPRAEFSLIHGELGPDHVLLDDRGEPVLIDIEGLLFFDVEWEHAFLALRFHEHHRWLDPGDLDADRLRLYRLAMHLSLVAGPLQLLDGDFPDREFMLWIARHHTEQAIAALSWSR